MHFCSTKIQKRNHAAFNNHEKVLVDMYLGTTESVKKKLTNSWNLKAGELEKQHSCLK